MTSQYRRQELEIMYRKEYGCPRSDEDLQKYFEFLDKHGIALNSA